MEQEFDLRPFARAFVRGWPLIVLFGFVVGAIAFALTTSQPRRFMAQSQIAIVPSETQANLNSNISEQQSLPNETVLRTGLVSFAATGIAPDVIKLIGDQLPEHLRDPAILQQLVVVNARGTTNIVQIQVTTDDQAQAKLIADAWGRVFVERANVLFGKQTQVSDLTTFVGDAQQNFQTLETTVATSPLHTDISRLAREATQINAILTKLRSTQLNLITNTLEQQADQQSVLLATARADTLDQLGRLRDTEVRLSRLRDEVLAFRELVAAGATSASSFAYGLLKTQLLAGTIELPTAIQSQVAFTDVPSLADVEALLSNTEARLTETREQLSILKTSFQDGDAYQVAEASTPSTTPPADQPATGVGSQANIEDVLASFGVTDDGILQEAPLITKFEARYRTIVTELQQKQSALFVLSQERDQARDKYLALNKRSTELQTASVGEESVVRFASESIPVPVAAGIGRNTLLAFVLGLLLGGLFLVMRTAMRNAMREPALPRQEGERQRVMEQV